MLSLILFNPSFSAFFAGFFERSLGHKGTKLLSICLLFNNFFIVICCFYLFCNFHLIEVLNLGIWIISNYFLVKWDFSIEILTIVMLFVVNFISFLVHLYSSKYMENDLSPHIVRFFSYISLFTFLMLILILGDNLLILFLGWEGIGLCSYLLISFWYIRVQANKSVLLLKYLNMYSFVFRWLYSTKYKNIGALYFIFGTFCGILGSILTTVRINWILDFGLTLGIISISYFITSIDFGILLVLCNFLADYSISINKYFIIYAITIISLLLFTGAIKKLAQISLHTWLPDVMEGPTPVSALLHAATMVTAGVFLLIKCSMIIENSTTILNIISFIGTTTDFFTATNGVSFFEVEKLVVFSSPFLGFPQNKFFRKIKFWVLFLWYKHAKTNTILYQIIFNDVVSRWMILTWYCFLPIIKISIDGENFKDHIFVFIGYNIILILVLIIIIIRLLWFWNTLADMWIGLQHEIMEMYLLHKETKIFEVLDLKQKVTKLEIRAIQFLVYVLFFILPGVSLITIRYFFPHLFNSFF